MHNMYVYCVSEIFRPLWDKNTQRDIVQKDREREENVLNIVKTDSIYTLWGELQLTGIINSCCKNKIQHYTHSE